ncbi:MAG: class I SAM-dependent methyltransferase [Bacillota bacterium]
MQPHIYDELGKTEQNHWWFVARRAILKAVIEKYLERSPKFILDAGCGTGGNLDFLKSLGGHVTAVEMNSTAARIAAEKHGIGVLTGSLPDKMPFPEESFDLITLLDVLEHVEYDEKALSVLGSLLRPGGYLLVTVPAFSFLWGYHDEVHDHKRRYRSMELANKIKKANLKMVYCSYFNFFLFPAIAAARFTGRLLSSKSPNGDLYMPPHIINNLLKAVMSSEAAILQNTRLPVGVSLIALACKN